MKRNFNLFCGILALCLVSNFSNGATATKLPFYYSLLFSKAPAVIKEKTETKAIDTYINVPYTISSSAVPEGGWHGVITLDDGGSTFAATETDALTGYATWVNTPDTYTVYFYGFAPGATCSINTDSQGYSGTADSSGEVVLYNVTINSSATLSAY